MISLIHRRTEEESPEETLYDSEGIHLEEPPLEEPPLEEPPFDEGFDTETGEIYEEEGGYSSSGDLPEDLDSLRIVAPDEDIFTELVEETKAEEIKGITDKLSTMSIVDLKSPNIVIDGSIELPVSLRILVENSSVVENQKRSDMDYYTFYIKTSTGDYLDIGDYSQSFVSIVGDEVGEENMVVTMENGVTFTGDDLDLKTFDPIFQ